MPGDVRIKQFELSDLDALLSFLRLAYPGEPLKGNAAFWKWQFLENPYVSPDNVPTWIATSSNGNEVVGQLAAIPMKLKVGEDELRAIWVINLIVLPEYRGHKLGERLFQFARETYCRTMIALGYNERSGAILRRLKWVDMGSMNRYHKLLFPGDAMKEIAQFAPARRIANLLYAPFRPRLTKLSLSLPSSPSALATGGALREVTHFDSSFDELWRDAAVQWRCAVVRSSRFLEWQFMKQPGKKFEVLGYYEKDRLLGYVVLFFRKAGHNGVSHKAAISDFCYSAENSQRVIGSLLKGALRCALERRAGALVTDVLNHQVERELRQFGFWRIKASPSFMVGVNDGTHQDLMHERSNWFLTRGDSDVSIFEEPNL